MRMHKWSFVGLPLSSGLIPVPWALVRSPWWSVGSLGSRIRPCFTNKQRGWTAKDELCDAVWLSEHNCIQFGSYILIPTCALRHLHVNIPGAGLSCLPQVCIPKVMLRERELPNLEMALCIISKTALWREVCFSDSELSNCINNQNN